MEAVEAWGRVHFSVTACYQEPDGTQIAVPLRVNNGLDDFWLATRPECKQSRLGRAQSVRSCRSVAGGVSVTNLANAYI
jgi:hypothetical protein